MFQEEWRLASLGPAAAHRHRRRKPAEQYLAPGVRTLPAIVQGARHLGRDRRPSEFAWDGERLLHAGQPVDPGLTASRISRSGTCQCSAARRPGIRTRPSSRHIRARTPSTPTSATSSPRRSAWLAEIGVSADARRLIAGHGAGHRCRYRAAAGGVSGPSASAGSSSPAASCGGKAAYRGDKLTKRVFEEILQGGYIAQALVPPSGRRLSVAGEPQQFKLDLRNYAFPARCNWLSPALSGADDQLPYAGRQFAPVFKGAEGAAAGKMPNAGAKRSSALPASPAAEDADRATDSSSHRSRPQVVVIKHAPRLRHRSSGKDFVPAP